MKAPRGWRTLDFPADNTGWRAVYLNDDNPGWTFERVVGWLLQEDVVYDARTCETSRLTTNLPCRIVVWLPVSSTAASSSQRASPRTSGTCSPPASWTQPSKPRPQNATTDNS